MSDERLRELERKWQETGANNNFFSYLFTLLCIPKTSRITIPNNRAGGPSDLISAHTDRGDTLIVEAPATTLNKLCQLPEHYTPLKTGALQWKNP